MLLYLLVIFWIDCCHALLTTACTFDIFSGIHMLLELAKDPASLICNIPSSVRVLLLIRGDELILSLMTRNFVFLPYVWFLKRVSNSPLIDSSVCNARSFVIVFWNSISCPDLCCKTLYWYSSMMLTSAPVSGSARMWTSFSINGIVFSNPYLFLTILMRMCATDLVKKSSSELSELSSSVSAVRFTVCFLFILLVPTDFLL